MKEIMDSVVTTLGSKIFGVADSLEHLAAKLDASE